MTPATMTQMMGAAPIAARRRAAVCVPAYLAARTSNRPNVTGSGFWGAVAVGHSISTKCPARHLAPRPT